LEKLKYKGDLYEYIDENATKSFEDSQTFVKYAKQQKVQYKYKDGLNSLRKKWDKPTVIESAPEETDPFDPLHQYLNRASRSRSHSKSRS